ncbi:MAG TPA: hypothetical protein VD973_22620 [Symbiobacteriaceae bacterium]|nr:hypothetical protein [Symbiobacteriaceae bacterium]
MAWWNMFLLPQILSEVRQSQAASGSGATSPAPSTPVATPQPCPVPPEYTFSRWQQVHEDRQFQGEWVVQYLHFTRTKTDQCRSTSETESMVQGPYRLWPAVPANRVADVSRPTGATDGLSGSPLRSSEMLELGTPGAVGPNPDVIVNSAVTVTTGTLPLVPPFYSGFALLAGAVVATLLLRRRSRQLDPAEGRQVGRVTRPSIPLEGARTLDSIKPGEEWVPSAVEVEWLQAFFGIKETGYGPRTQEAMAAFQREHKIEPDPKVMVGINTYKALWKEHIELVHDRWQRKAEGRRPIEMDLLLNSPLPSDLRAEMNEIDDAYSAYWKAVEGRYQAILRRDSAQVARYEKEIQELKAGGVRLGDILVLKEKYQPLIDALYAQAEKVKNTANDVEYAKLQAMLAAIEEGDWNGITTANATLAGRVGALFRRDKTESLFGANIAVALQPHVSSKAVTGLPVDPTEPVVLAPIEGESRPYDSVDTGSTPDATVPETVPPVGQTHEPVAVTVDDLDAQLAKYYPNPADRLIVRHTVAEEGPGKFGANWGGVVYRNNSGHLVSDRQWINFGLISFAYPSGAGGGVLKTLMSDPEEEKAFRQIAERFLTDNPGGEVAEGWRHLLNDPGNYVIPVKTKQQLADEFVAAIKSGNGLAHQDWMFKYLNTPVTKSGTATGDMRDDWNNVLVQFLSRPASQAVQLSIVRKQYYDAAVESALDPNQFGLTTIRGVGFLFDVMVQHGTPTPAMMEIAATEEYQQASEIRKLEMLRDTFSRGSTAWNRRDSVLRSKVLTDDPYLR